MKNILVFYGGISCEHDVSVVTGVLTLNSLDKEKYNPIPVYVTKNGEWLSGSELFDVAFYKHNDFKKIKRVTLVSGEKSLYLKGRRLKKLADIYCAINCMHGLNGEDGCLAGTLKLLGIPLASPDMFGSSFAIDKEFTKIVLKGLNVKSLPYVSVTKNEYVKDINSLITKIHSSIDYPLILKPANLGLVFLPLTMKKL